MKKTFILILISLVVFTVSACGQNKPNGLVSNTSTSTASISTTSTTTNTSVIDKNNVATWPRFEFKELGFSVQLPFEKSDVEIEYDECRGGKFYSKNNDIATFSLGTGDACADPRSNFSYYHVKIKKGNYIALSSVVGYSPIGGEGGILTDDKGNPIFKQIGKPFTKITSPTGTVYILNDKNYQRDQIIHPLKVNYTYKE